jgi:hypothetical protein
VFRGLAVFKRLSKTRLQPTFAANSGPKTGNPARQDQVRQRYEARRRDVAYRFVSRSAWPTLARLLLGLDGCSAVRSICLAYIGECLPACSDTPRFAFDETRPASWRRSITRMVCRRGPRCGHLATDSMEAHPRWGVAGPRSHARTIVITEQAPDFGCGL